jgi:phage terminase large subunit-like protein
MHRVEAYAREVGSGAIVAGPFVRLACRRHLADLEKAWGYRFDARRADAAIGFFETVLKLPDLVDEDGKPEPFRLQPWQAFIVGSLFGWVDGLGLRRFREAYIETGKGSGKTPMCAGIGLYGLVMDGERAAEVYAAAADQDQAQILFRDAVRIAQASPELWEIILPSGGEHVWQLQHKPSLSFFKTFSRESGAKSGTRPHMALLDELHEHPTPQVSMKIRAGAKRRNQPMFIEITNSGFDRNSICWHRHEHSRKVLESTVEDDQLFAYVCALDEGDDPLKDEGCWIKTNPNLGISITHEYLRRQVKNAINIPSETNTVLRLNFCVWTQADHRAINMDQWRACKAMPTDQELVRALCFGCLDLGETDDFTAWGLLWVLDDGRVAVKMKYWIPDVALERYPDRPYHVWQREGKLTVTEGPVTDYAIVRQQILEDCRTFGVKEVFYDMRTARETAQILIADGIVMVQMAQGFALHEAIKRLLSMVAEGDLCHGDDPILAWMADNTVVLTGIKGEKRLAKERAPEKIDGIAALVMGVEGAIVRRERIPEVNPVLFFVGGRLKTQLSPPKPKKPSQKSQQRERAARDRQLKKERERRELEAIIIAKQLEAAALSGAGKKARENAREIMFPEQALPVPVTKQSAKTTRSPGVFSYEVDRRAAAHMRWEPWNMRKRRSRRYEGCY